MNGFGSSRSLIVDKNVISKIIENIPSYPTDCEKKIMFRETPVQSLKCRIEWIYIYVYIFFYLKGSTKYVRCIFNFLKLYRPKLMKGLD